MLVPSVLPLRRSNKPDVLYAHLSQHAKHYADVLNRGTLDAPRHKPFCNKVRRLVLAEYASHLCLEDVDVCNYVTL